MQGHAILDRYRITAELGKGGRGVVYLAEDLLLGREVAIKIILPECVTPISKERFRKEAQTVAKLTHPAIVPVYDFGEENDQLFIVMQVVRGETLRAMIDDGSMTPDHLIELALQIADALDYSHNQGVVHRDIKPENIMVEWHRDRLPQAKVLDFGLALDDCNTDEDGVAIQGTILYISPEQLTGDPVDGRSDIYSLGMVLYESLAGQHPFAGGGGMFFERILAEHPPPLSERGIDVCGELDRLISACLSKDPSARPVNAREVLQALQRTREMLDCPQGVAVPVEMAEPLADPLDHPPSFADRLGDLLLVQGEYLEAREAYRKARETRRLASGTLPPEIEAGYLSKLAQLEVKLGRYDEALDRCRRGLVLAAAADPRLATELAAWASLVCCARGDYRLAGQWTDQGRRQLRRATVAGHDTRPVEVLLLRAEGNLLLGLRKTARATQSFRKALAVAETLEDRWERSIALFNVGEALLEAGDRAGAMDFLNQAIEAKSAIGDRWGLAYVHHALASLHLQQEDQEAAVARAETGLRLAAEIGDPKINSRLAETLGRAHFESGRFEQATKQFRAALQEAERIASKPEIDAARRGLEAIWERMGIGERRESA